MSRPLTSCAQGGCPELVERGYCPRHKRERQRPYWRRRASARKRGYDATWERTRRAFLAEHPLCECDDCEQLPPTDRPQAVDVHHRDDLGPDGPRGHDFTNLRAMAHDHHARHTARDHPGGWNA